MSALQTPSPGCCWGYAPAQECWWDWEKTLPDDQSNVLEMQKCGVWATSLWNPCRKGDGGRVSRLHSQLLPEEKEPSLEEPHLSFCHFSFPYLVYIMFSWTPSLPDLLEKEVILQITVTNLLQGQKNFEVKPSLIWWSNSLFYSVPSAYVPVRFGNPLPGPCSGMGTFGCSAWRAVELTSLSHP